ncbi:aminoacyl-histidine dipeptidase [Helcococcus ovis]|uniref:Cytosol non-specific dipeptidase n=1 Tax=Helcococcus ovis TaxID=72026 RepID=A0A4R9C1F1_9FIRM|nr:aminoacyl-histidine dipeptidase [Helcococcus ovis]TFF64269.1 aminoacyl-histidine dipeptidase [Helcococcus ovis]TFF66432.1 aminoacyl-histidine dipeptidase [Helcococcus ovis]TFF67384.1 aminoacyl-histidine dipeptidase [Helcococcus ovis]WNZ01871.1 aminoacyl-histidine dipeptidase [Helcococcus ovis]
MQRLLNSSAYDVFKNFEKISKIPRCSHDEEAISKFIYDFGKNLGLETIRDQHGNVIIVKPASKGYEDKETVILQGHMDMVCEKSDSSTHDFTCDPIELIVEEDFIHANNTTLGADDGIAVAMMMAILENDSLKHPKLEALFTTTEETGMDGAIGLSENVLTGKNLINIDNEEDKIIIVGCAGGINAYLEKRISKNTKKLQNFELKVSGLQGGHSGIMINENRLNAIKILDEILLKLSNDIDYFLYSINGGTKHNAIPSSASVIIGIYENDKNLLSEKLEEIFNDLRPNLLKDEKDLQFTLNEIEAGNLYINCEEKKEILNILNEFPHGVNTLDEDLNIVKSSNNLAILKTEDDIVKIQTSIRSSDSSDLDYLKNKVREIAEKYNFDVKFSEGYPMWKPNFDYVLLNHAKEIYKELRNEYPEVAVIHAGLETGILSQKYPDINMISIGPDIFGAHTPVERLSISSTEFSFNFVKNILKSL